MGAPGSPHADHHVSRRPADRGVGLACVKEGKGVEVNGQAFFWASFANLAAALKGKLGKDVSHHLKSLQASNNMNVANSYGEVPKLS